jgi:hypothetical protein
VVDAAVVAAAYGAGSAVVRLLLVMLPLLLLPLL